MKKTYIHPSMKVVKIETPVMLANSVRTNGTPITDPNDIGSRDFFDWDDEEEDF